MIKKTPINNQIRAEKIRLIDEQGKQVGVISLEEGLRMARERDLDLIQVTEKVEPPVCKIMNYGKYLYHEKKKEKPISKTQNELKIIRFGSQISPNDLETRAMHAAKFIQKNHRVRVELVLRGREKAFTLSEFAKGKINQFVERLNAITPIKIERELKREARGFTIMLAKKQ